MRNVKSVGVIGIRGYRVIYSGFETFVTYLIKKSKKNHYYLFCRNLYQRKQYQKKNLSLVLIPTIKNKYIETPFYSLLSNIKSLVLNLDTILYLGLSNTPFILLQKLFGRRVIVNVDGLDWKRKRWNILGKFYLRFCELITVMFADVIISDSNAIYNRYKKNYSFKKNLFIPYGAEAKKVKSGKTLTKFKLQPRKYIHFVGRLTPENCVEDLIMAFKYIKTNIKCVIIGDSIYEDLYKAYLIKIAQNDSRIVFTGFLKGREYEEVCSNSLLYVETKSQGGIHPSLLEAVAFDNAIIARDNSSHKEVLGSTAQYFNNKNTNLSKTLEMFLNNQKRITKKNSSVRNKLMHKYRWDKIIEQYEEVFDTH